MVERHLEELETKVQVMIKMIRKLREEKTVLEERLSRTEREMLKWQEEKGAVRQRIERILEDLDALEAVTNLRGSR
jgi:septal ring factor EnvC (AmiA/AmiB activator)